MRNGGRNKVNPDEMAHNEHWRAKKVNADEIGKNEDWGGGTQQNPQMTYNGDLRAK